MKTIAVLSRKGGAGKTTLSVSLAVAAQQTGLKVVLADTDPLRSSSVILGSGPAARTLVVESKPGKLRAVREACRRQGCDLLIIDTPPAPESDVARAIEVADLCLAVARPTALDLAAVAQTIEQVARARRRGLIVLNQCQAARGGAESALTRRALETLASARLGVAQTRLRSRAAYQHAAGAGQTVTEWQPSKAAAADVLCLLAEVALTLRIAEHEEARRRSVFEACDGGLPATASGEGHGWRMATAGVIATTAGDFWT